MNKDMNKDTVYFRQARLMLSMIPYVAEQKCFALKGGTAINFFVRDMPRLSVDIDLVYLPLEPRDVALAQISESLKKISLKVRGERKDLTVHVKGSSEGHVTKLFVGNGREQITIEPNEVMRGAVYEVGSKSVSPEVEKFFEMSATAPVLNFADLYGGKLCAALDRQHPRDVFDIKILFENEGIIPEVRKAFVVYLAGHDRPIHELLNPVRKDLKPLFDRDFLGMTIKPVEYKKLVEVRENYIAAVNKILSMDEKNFLLSLKNGDPQWDLLGIKDVEKLPAIQWKFKNIQLLKTRNPKKHSELFRKLEKALNVR